MSRRHQAKRREVTPDPKYKSELVARFINKVMIDGKKSIAQNIVYGALERLKEETKAPDTLEAFQQVIDNVQPAVEVKSKRVGGATYQVPFEIRPARRVTLAMRWIVMFSRKKSGRSMEEALFSEFKDAYNNQGASVKKKEDTHKMAESNKAFAHLA